MTHMTFKRLALALPLVLAPLLIAMGGCDEEEDHGPYSCEYTMEIHVGDETFHFYEGECYSDYGDGNLEVECYTSDLYAQVGFQNPGEGYFEMSVGDDFWVTEDAHIEYDITDNVFTGEFSCVLDSRETTGCFDTPGETY